MSLGLAAELWRLNKQQWAPQEERDAIALARLQRQVGRAWQFSPFYRKRFDDIGFHPSDLKQLSDLSKLPITTRADYISAEKSIYCTDIDIDRCVWAKSSGSSGAPVRVPLTPRDKARRVLKELRALKANGYRYTDRMLIIWVPRATIDKRPMLQSLGLLRRYYASVFDDEVTQLDNINSLAPEVLYTYTSDFRILSEAILTDGLKAPRPRLVVTSAELLDEPTRRLINKAFGADPVDFYGSMEVGWVSWQCPERKGYHINSDCVVVECLRDDGKPTLPGEEGELVITNLQSDAAPLIRYSTGDAAALSSAACACGRTLPLMSKVAGRVADYFTLPSGRRLSPYIVTSALRDLPGIGRFQVLQESVQRVRVRVLDGKATAEPESICKIVNNALGPQVDVQVDYADSLPREASGKFKIVESLVRGEAMDAVSAQGNDEGKR